MPLPYGANAAIPYLNYSDPGLPGLFRDISQVDTYINSGGDTAQVVTIDIGTAANSTTYNITALGTTVPFISDSTATATEIRDGLIAALSGTIIGSRFTIAIVDADTLTLTNQILGQDDVVTVSGGGTGYAATNTASGTSARIGYGLIVCTKAGYGSVFGTPVAALPTGSSDRVLGITGGTHAEVAQGSNPNVVGGIYSAGLMNVMKRGSIWAVSEVAIAQSDSLYYRHTTSGAFTQVGVISNASGTGKSALSGVAPCGDSVVLYNGTIIVPVNVTLA